MNYIPLRIKTNYSLLTSLIKIDELINECKKLNINTLSICDNNMYGVMEFYKTCIKNNIKPIIGLEITLNDKNVCLYAKNYKGYQNLCYISSNIISKDLLKENCDDLICIIPYESIDLYDELSNIYDLIFISYKSKEERNNITDKKCIFSNVVRCLKKEDKEYLKYVYMIKDNTTILDENNYIFDENNYLLTNEEASNYINKIDLINYKIIEESINVEIKTKDDLLPKFNNDDNFNEYEYLCNLCKKGLLKRFNNKVPIKYAERLMYELEIINKMHFSNYFLVVWDYIKFAKKNNILIGPGRGSCVGSLVSYVLGITDIDPLKYDLLFERFLNPQRVSMPDIDVDFDSSKRQLVIDYVTNKYGEKNVTQIIAFSSLKSRAVLRDVCKIFNVDNLKADNFIKTINAKQTLEENKENILIKTELEKDVLLSKIYDVSIHLENLKRQTSIHASGIIISSKQLDRYIPIFKNDNNEYVASFDKDYLEELGLLKMDFLSVDNLTFISELLNVIKDVDFKNISLNDEKTLNLFKEVKTDGIFQFETNGLKNVLKKIDVTSFDDLLAAIALFRPGAMDSIDLYAKRKNGKEKINYIHEDLKPILESTYGIIIYQEQVMQIASIMAGYSLGEADILRRAMSKKSHEIMTLEKDKFVNRSINRGYDKNISEEVYELIYKFADFGFNKSHSVGYATLAFKMAYLKAHYPKYFMCQLLNNVIGNKINTKKYIDELKSYKIDILLPSINESDSVFKVLDKGIRFPISCIESVGINKAKQIISIKQEGYFKDFFDFVKRCYSNIIDKKTIEYLIYSSSFDEFNYNHKTLINNLDSAINYAELSKDLDDNLIKKPQMIIYDEYTKDELINQEYNSFGFYLSFHPVQNYRNNNINSLSIKDYFNKRIVICLIIDRINVIKSKNNEKMAFITASDEYGQVDCVMFPKVYKDNFMINKGNIVLINAKVEKRYNEYQLLINSIEKCN